MKEIKEIYAKEAKERAELVRRKKALGKIKRENQKENMILKLNKDLYRQTLAEIYKKVKKEAQEGGMECYHFVYPADFKFPGNEKISNYEVDSDHKELIIAFAACLARKLRVLGYKVSYDFNYLRCDCKGDDRYSHYHSYRLALCIKWN